MAFNYLKHAVCLIDPRYTDALSAMIYYFSIAVFIGIIAFALILIIVRLALRLENFKKDLRYLNMEIGRTRGSEKKHWQREKRRLWLSLIPFHK